MISGYINQEQFQGGFWIEASKSCQGRLRCPNRAIILVQPSDLMVFYKLMSLLNFRRSYFKLYPPRLPYFPWFMFTRAPARNSPTKEENVFILNGFVQRQNVTGPAKQGTWAQTTPYHITGHNLAVEQNICFL